MKDYDGFVNEGTVKSKILRTRLKITESAKVLNNLIKCANVQTSIVLNPFDIN